MLNILRSYAIVYGSFIECSECYTSWCTLNGFLCHLFSDHKDLINSLPNVDLSIHSFCHQTCQVLDNKLLETIFNNRST